MKWSLPANFHPPSATFSQQAHPHPNTTHRSFPHKRERESEEEKLCEGKDKVNDKL